MSESFRNTLSTQDGRRMLMELIAYAHALPETLQLGANHIINHMQFKAQAPERAKTREPVKPAKGVKTSG